MPCDLETIDDLVGDDGRWTNLAAAMDPSRSVGASPEAKELRLVTDNLVAALTSESPGLIAATSSAEWRLAHLHGRTAAGLLRYHAAMADTSDSRLCRLLSERDAMMYANLQAIAAEEAQRGPTLVFAHNGHLQKYRSTMQLSFGGVKADDKPAGWEGLEGAALSWWGAGAIAAARMGGQYAFLASTLGSAPDRGIDAPKPDTLEGTLATIAEDRCIFNSRRLAEYLNDVGAKLTPRTDTSSNYSALDPERLDGTDGVIYIRDIRW